MNRSIPQLYVSKPGASNFSSFHMMMCRLQAQRGVFDESTNEENGHHAHKVMLGPELVSQVVRVSDQDS